MENGDKIAVAWCDSNYTTGAFTQGLLSMVVHLKEYEFSNIIRVDGIEISTQRQLAFDSWMNQTDADWILWIDSDIEINNEIIKELFETANKDTYPVVSGLYFTMGGYDKDGLLVPKPCFNMSNEGNVLMKRVPDYTVYDKMLEVNTVGMGLFIMHRSVGQKLLDDNGYEHMFAEIHYNDDHSNLMGEDAVFCAYIRKSGFPIYINTNVIPVHHKLIKLDNNYNRMYIEKSKK